MIRCIQNKDGKTHLDRCFMSFDDEEKKRLLEEVHVLVTVRDIVYRRYAVLYFCIYVDVMNNSLMYLEGIHNFVKVLNELFHNVCELDLVFSFYKVYEVVDKTGDIVKLGLDRKYPIPTKRCNNDVNLSVNICITDFMYFCLYVCIRKGSKTNFDYKF